MGYFRWAGAVTSLHAGFLRDHANRSLAVIMFCLGVSFALSDLHAGLVNAQFNVADARPVTDPVMA